MKPHEVRHSTNEELIKAYRTAASEMRRIENGLEDVNSRFDSIAWRRRDVLMDEIVQFLNGIGKPNVASALRFEHHFRKLETRHRDSASEAAFKQAQAVLKATVQAEQRARKLRHVQDFEDYLALSEPHMLPTEERRPTLAEEKAWQLTGQDMVKAEKEGVLEAHSPEWYGAFIRTYREHLLQGRMKYQAELDRLIDERMYEIAAEKGIRIETEVVHVNGTNRGVVKRIFHNPGIHIGPGPWSILCEVVEKARGLMWSYPLHSLVAVDRIPHDKPPLFDVDYSYRNVAGRKLEGVTMNVTPAQVLEEVSRVLQHGRFDVRIAVRQVE